MTETPILKAVTVKENQMKRNSRIVKTPYMAEITVCMPIRGVGVV